MSVEYDPSPLRDYWKNFERHKAALEVQSRKERRERIATAALQALVSNPVAAGSAAYFAHQATSYADALIAALDKEPQP